MPSTQSCRRLLGLALVVCLCTQSAAGAVAADRPQTAASGCFPGDAEIERGEAVGDVVDLELLLCFSGSVTVSGPGYAANASLGDGNWSGGVTMRFDTRRNGSQAVEVTTDRDHTVTMNASGNGSFEPGTYTVTVRNWGGDVVDTLEFTLGRPRATDVTVFEAPEGAAADLQTVAAVREAVATAPADSARRFDDPNTSDHLNLATNETLVVAVRADGLEGTMENGTGTPLSRFRTAVEEAGGAISMRQTEETVTPQRQPLRPDVLNSSATHLVPDADNDTYYLVVDTRRLWGEWGGNHGGPVNVGSRAGMGYAVRFSMQGGIDDETLPSDLVAADLAVVEAAVAGPPDAEEPVALPPEENASLRLRTSLAAGTPVTVTVTGHPDGPIERTVRVQRVENDSVVTLELNLSGVPNGTALDAAVQRGNETLDETVNAVVSTGPEETETQTETDMQTETQTPQSATETETESPKPGTSTPAPDSPTPRPVPGFGALHGVAALLVAVLALRRSRN